LSTASGIISLFDPLATLARVAPALLPLAGGQRILITGTGLRRCTGLRIGGVAVQDWIPYNDTVATAVTRPVPELVADAAADSNASAIPVSMLGGAHRDGSGPALVELVCGVGLTPAATPLNAIVAAAFLVNYTTASLAAAAATDDGDGEDFLQSAGGKFVLIFTCAFVIVAAVIVVRRRFAAQDALDGHPAPDDDWGDADVARSTRRGPRGRRTREKRQLPDLLDRLDQQATGEPPSDDAADAPLLPLAHVDDAARPQVVSGPGDSSGEAGANPHDAEMDSYL
jgi:hypothetical protein